MKKNMGTADRIIRIVIALVFAALFYMDIISGVLGIVLISISVIFLLTSLINYCPIYGIFGLRTNKASTE
jgi:Inner membrane protein YgaP-like, transmembrane domain